VRPGPVWNIGRAATKASTNGRSFVKELSLSLPNLRFWPDRHSQK
jgi:hypothetical protein